MRTIYDYSKPLNNNAHVAILNMSKRKDFETIIKSINCSAEKYGFSFSIITHRDIDNFIKIDKIVRLLIIVTDQHFSTEISQTALNCLSKFSAVSVVFEYNTFDEMISFSKRIDLFKKESSDKINFLRPTLDEVSGKYIVPAFKIIENSVCDSVRIKYSPICSKEQIKLNPEIKDFFEKASLLFKDYSLYHRSASDGYFAIRDGNSEAFYVTSTKTYKDTLDLERISRVTHYERETNKLYYEGRFLPSSDSVEAAIVFDQLRDIKTIVHTHASVLFTRNNNFSHKILVPIAPYGESRTGDLIVEALKNVPDGFIIMEDHGEVFANSDKHDVSRTLFNLLNSTK